MALPGDVTTVTVSFGPYTDAEGAVALVGAKGKLFPVDPATGKRLNLVHVATGQEIIPSHLVITVGSDGTDSVGPIPHTDNAGLSTVGFAYRVEWDIASNKPSPGNKTFAVPAASGSTVDFDLLDVAAAVPGVLVPVGVGPQGDKGDPGSQYPMVVHGDDQTVVRPTTTLPVVWFGTVDPLNADDTKDITIPLGSDEGGFEIAPSDEGVAALVADTASGTAAALRAAIGTHHPRLLSPLVGVLGDSLSAGSDTATLRRDSPLHFAAIRSNGVIQYAYQGGVTGENSTQIAARATDFVAAGAKTVVVLMGANDGAGTGPFDTTTRPNLDATVADILAEGGTPVLATLPPRGTAASPATDVQRRFITRYNLYVRRLATRLGTPLVDYYAALVSPDGDYYGASYANDGLHPNAAGYIALGDALKTALTARLAEANVPLPLTNNDPLSLADNCLMLTTSGGLPVGWTITQGSAGAGGLTVSTVAATKGNKLRMDVAGSTAQKTVGRMAIPVTPGNRILVVCQMAWSGLTTILQIDRKPTTGGTDFAVLRPQGDTPSPQSTLTPFAAEYVVPAGTASINVQATVQLGTGWLELSQFAVYDLTANAQL